MPPIKQKYKAEVKETHSKEEIAIQSIINSEYHLMIPMHEAKYVRVKNPITGVHNHFATADEGFFVLLNDLSQRGLGQKILSDLEYFANNYDSNWFKILENYRNYLVVLG